MSQSFQQKATITFNIAFGLYLVQLAMIFITTMWWVPTHKTPNFIIGFIIAAPLLILLPWLIKRNIRAFVWLCFVQLGYFMPATEHMFMYKQYGLAPFIEATLTVLLFITAMLFARWEQKQYGISVTR